MLQTRLILFFALALLAFTNALRAEDNGDELKVYLITIGPGELIYEKFGHNMIRIQDAAAGIDISYNYGMFDFDQERFFLRYLQGEMLYSMGGFDSELVLQEYFENDRSIWQQELNLTPGQRVALRDFLEWNALPQNRDYRYDYYRDNCSTRVRDAIDGVLDGQIRRQTESIPTGRSYRWHTLRLIGDSVFWHSSLHAALGQPADQTISAWDEMFVPMEMMKQFDDLTIAGPDGPPIPLVEHKIERRRSQLYAELPAPPKWFAGYLIGGAAIGGLLAWLGMVGQRIRAGRIGFATCSILLLLLIGFGGLISLTLWLFSNHHAASRNENLFQCNPLALIAAVMLPLAMWRGGRARRWLPWIVVGVLAVAFLGLVIQILPRFSQDNAEIIALILPIHAGLAWGVWKVTKPADAKSQA